MDLNCNHMYLYNREAEGVIKQTHIEGDVKTGTDIGVIHITFGHSEGMLYFRSHQIIEETRRGFSTRAPRESMTCQCLRILASRTIRE